MTFIPTVLFWTTCFGTEVTISTDYDSYDYNLSGSIVDSDGLTTAPCPAKCFFTNDRDHLERSNLIIFHSRDLRANDLPETRDPSQLWVLWNHEAPFMSSQLDIWVRSNWTDIAFNLTLTYRTDSDLPLPYGRTIARKNPLATSNMTQIKQFIKSKFDQANSNRTQIKMAAWLVSNCETQSKREDFVSELSKLISVDIYGRCGNQTCGMRWMKDKECYEMVEQEYWFYLSFENAFCTDYITEKAFNILSYNIVPIVYGAVNYSSLLPPHSFIDATTMTPTELATHLQTLVNDSNKYLEYFKWKQNYKIVHNWDSSELFDNLECGLCGVIHDRLMWNKSTSTILPKPIFNGSSSKTLKEIADWYYNGQCTTPRVMRIMQIIEKIKRMSSNDLFFSTFFHNQFLPFVFICFFAGFCWFRCIWQKTKTNISKLQND